MQKITSCTWPLTSQLLAYFNLNQPRMSLCSLAILIFICSVFFYFVLFSPITVIRFSYSILNSEIVPVGVINHHHMPTNL